SFVSNCVGTRLSTGLSLRKPMTNGSRFATASAGPSVTTSARPTGAASSPTSPTTAPAREIWSPRQRRVGPSNKHNRGAAGLWRPLGSSSGPMRRGGRLLRRPRLGEARELLRGDRLLALRGCPREQLQILVDDLDAKAVGVEEEQFDVAGDVA